RHRNWRMSPRIPPPLRRSPARRRDDRDHRERWSRRRRRDPAARRDSRDPAAVRRGGLAEPAARHRGIPADRERDDDRAPVHHHVCQRRRSAGPGARRTNADAARVTVGRRDHALFDGAAHTVEDERMVSGDGRSARSHPRTASWNGRVTTTAVPDPVSETTSTWPPSTRVRSRMPTRPNPLSGDGVGAPCAGPTPLPLSSTFSSIDVTPIFTVTLASLAFECLTMLLTASWTIRKM